MLILTKSVCIQHFYFLLLLYLLFFLNVGGGGGGRAPYQWGNISDMLCKTLHVHVHVHFHIDVIDVPRTSDRHLPPGSGIRLKYVFFFFSNRKYRGKLPLASTSPSSGMFFPISSYFLFYSLLPLSLSLSLSLSLAHVNRMLPFINSDHLTRYLASKAADAIDCCSALVASPLVRRHLATGKLTTAEYRHSKQHLSFVSLQLDHRQHLIYKINFVKKSY